MLDFLPSLLRTPVAFVIVLGVLVFVHEMGHYLAARWRGVHVETFSIGFGRPWATWTDKHDTVWKLAWIPLGGYVKLHGQERPEDVAPEVSAAWIKGRTFHEKSVLSRAIVVAAGPVANFVLALVLFIGLIVVVGKPLATPVVGEVMADSAAAQAGMKAGDVVLGITDPTTTQTPPSGQTPSQPAQWNVTTFQDIQAVVENHAGAKLILHIQRDGKPMDLDVVPQSHDAGDGKTVGLLGIRGTTTVFEQVPVWQAIPDGAVQTWQVGVQTLAGVWTMITSHQGGEDFGGPLRIAEMSGQVAALGTANLISFIAVLSINLGLINLFPIPVLDGGHLMFYAAEAIRGRPLPVRAQEYGFRAGFALLIGLFVFATWNDLSHIGLFRWVAGLRG